MTQLLPKNQNSQGSTLRISRSNLAKLFAVVKPRLHSILKIFWSLQVVVIRKHFHRNNILLGSLISAIVRKARVLIFGKVSPCVSSLRNTRFFPSGLNKFDGIEMYIGKEIFQIPVAGHVPRFVLSLKQRARPVVSCIKVHGVPSAEFLHKQSDAARTHFFDKQMEMVRHQAISAYVNQFFTSVVRFKYTSQGRTLRKAFVQIVDAGRFSTVAKIQQFHKALAALVIHKYFPLFRTSVVKVVELAGRSKSICHGTNIPIGELFARFNLAIYTI